MQCDRLIKMIKSWYIHVRDETMAPARMVSFMEQHAETCEICLQDPDLKAEIAKITELILPESKIPKAIRQQNEKAALKEAEAEAPAAETASDDVEDTVADTGEDADSDQKDSEDGVDSVDADDEDLELNDDPELLGTPDV